MHRIKSFGIVDRDYLGQGQIDAYQRTGVFVPDVAEVDNLFLVPELIQAVAQQLVVDPERVLKEVTSFVLDEFERFLPVHAMEVTKYRVSLQMGRFSSTEEDINQYSRDFNNFHATIDPQSIHSAALEEAKAAIRAKDYQLVLRLFNKKDLPKNLGRFFGITRGSYVEKVLEMAKRDLGNVPLLLRNYLPAIEGSL